jgi:hypothetical protein
MALGESYALPQRPSAFAASTSLRPAGFIISVFFSKKRFEMILPANHPAKTFSATLGDFDGFRRKSFTSE